MPLGYATFASFYDLSIEWVYRPMRVPTAKAGRLKSTDRVLDLATGTGQLLPALAAEVPDGSVLGLDLSPEMVARAKVRVDRDGLSNVSVRSGDLFELDEPFDAVAIALGLSVIGPWEEAFAHTWNLLKPGGRYVIFDVHAERWNPQTSIVTYLAGADISRKVWEPLLDVASDGEVTRLPGSPWIHGGHLYLASGTKG